ncbi:MAG TPA: heme-binding domain-containing protein [Acidimicrobiales bacterium]|nr:heme-binding domain-containing protein [Acidimicrobiales bacterium]
MTRLAKLVLLVVVLFALAQLVPFRVKNHPVVSEPNWDSARTKQLFAAACSDCHSNQTRPRWYEKVAPVSWWINHHVEDGRAALNVSECGRGREGGREGPETVREGSMPPSYYTWFGLHPDAKLTATERQQLADGLAATARLGCTK